MLVHPWDEATREEWQQVLATHDFGELVTAGHVDGYPVVVPTHFVYDDPDVLLHLARPNPVWRALEQDPRVVLSLATDWTYVEAAWNSDTGEDPHYGVPTSYYTAVQLRGTAEILDDPEEKAAVLRVQLAHFEPRGSTRVPPRAESESDRRQLPGIRAIRVRVEQVLAKQKYGGNKTVDHRHRIADRLAERNAPGDPAARTHLLRRTPRT
ncbi:MAG: FMN-binding negative transcriptional regulator [Marmoricola sp.]